MKKNNNLEILYFSQIFTALEEAYYLLANKEAGDYIAFDSIKINFLEGYAEDEVGIVDVKFRCGNTEAFEECQKEGKQYKEYADEISFNIDSSLEFIKGMMFERLSSKYYKE